MSLDRSQTPTELATMNSSQPYAAGNVDQAYGRVFNTMNEYMGPAIPASADNTLFAPTRPLHLPPAKIFMGYLAHINPQMMTMTNIPYKKLTVKLNCGFAVRTLNVNAFPNTPLSPELKIGDQVKLEVVQTGAQGQYHNLQSIVPNSFNDCLCCEHPIQGNQYNQISTIIHLIDDLHTS